MTSMTNTKVKLLLTTFIIAMLSACGSSVKNSKYQGYSRNQRDVYVQGSLNNYQKQEVTMVAFSMLNTKYNWGGKKPDFGVDCSGLVTYVFEKSIGMKITGAAKNMAQKGGDVPLSHVNGKLEPGDLLFFNTTGASFSHVGIYIGEDKFLHASSGQKQVIISSINNKYFNTRLERIRRL